MIDDEDNNNLHNFSIGGEDEEEEDGSTKTATKKEIHENSSSALPPSPSSSQSPSNQKQWYMNSAEEMIHQSNVDRKIRTLTFLSAIGGFLFGYDTGVISGAMLPLSRTMELTKSQEEMVVSVTILASAISSSIIIGNICNQCWGRRGTILCSSILFLVGSLLLGLSNGYEMLIVGRVIVGIAIGLSSLTTPIYIAEVAMPENRGKLVTINTLFVCIGQFVAGMIDGVCEVIDPTNGWRMMLGFAALPSLIMMFGFLCCLPESPRWLIAKGRVEEGRFMMYSLRYNKNLADEEVKDIIQSLESENGNVMGCFGNCCEMLKHKPTRSALYVGCGLMMLQQFSGINTIMYYAATIYEMSSFDENTAIWLSGFTAFAQVMTVFLSIFWIDRVGRRKLVLVSLTLVTVSLMGLGMTFYAHRIYSDPISYTDKACTSQEALVWDGMTKYCSDCVKLSNCGYSTCQMSCVDGNKTTPFSMLDMCFGGKNDTTWYYDSCPTTTAHPTIEALSVFFMIFYLLAFGIGMGGLPWTICSEIFISKHRSLATSITTSTNWICNLIISSTFLTISDSRLLTAYGSFWCYGVIAFVGTFWMYCSLPETKGKSLEDMEYLFDNDASYKSLQDNEEEIILEKDHDTTNSMIEMSDGSNLKVV